MFDDLDEICDTINILEGKKPLREEPSAAQASKPSTTPGAARPSSPGQGEEERAAAAPAAASAAPAAAAPAAAPEAAAAPAAAEARGAAEAGGELQALRTEVELLTEQGQRHQRQLEAQAAELRQLREAQAGVRHRPALTLEVVLRIQRELYDHYASMEFQRKLKEIEAVYGKAYEDRGGAEERDALLLTVHSQVLPKFGYEGTLASFKDLLVEASAFNGNMLYAENRNMLNQLLGLQPSPEDLSRTSSARASGKGGPSGKGKGKGKVKGKSGQVRVGEVLSLIARDSPWSLRRPDDMSTTTGTEATGSEDPEGM